MTKSSSTQINTTPRVTRNMLRQRIQRLAKQHSMIAYQEGLVMVVTGETTCFLLCLGDEDRDLPKEQLVAAAQRIARFVDRGIPARICWPKDWPEVARMITSGDWRN